MERSKKAIWDVIGLSAGWREFLADNIEQSESSGISTKLDKDDNYVNGEMGRLLDEAKTNSRVDDLTTEMNLLDKFYEAGRPVASRPQPWSRARVYRKTLFNSEATG